MITEFIEFYSFHPTDDGVELRNVQVATTSLDVIDFAKVSQFAI